MKRARLQFATSLLNAFWRALWPLNLLLSAFAVLQIFLVLLALLGDSIPLPQFAVDKIREEAKNAGFDIRFDRAYFGFPCSVKIIEPACRLDATPADFFSAKSVELSFWPSSLLVGVPAVKNFVVADGKLSPTVGGNFGGIDKIRLKLFRCGSWWNVETLDFRLGSFCAETSGTIADNFNAELLFDSDAEEKVSPANVSPTGGAESKEDAFVSGFAARLDRILVECGKFAKYGDMFDAPFLRTEFMLSGDDVALRAEFSAASANFEIDGRNAIIKNFRAWAQGGGSGTANFRIFADCENFSGDGLLSCGAANARAIAVLEDGVFSLERINLAAKKISYGGAEIGDAFIRKSYLSSDSWRDDWRMFGIFGGRRIRATLSFSEDKSVSFSAVGTLDADAILSRPELADIEELKEFSFPNGLDFDVSGSASFDGSSAEAAGSLSANECIVMGVPVNRLALDASYDLSQSIVRAENIDIHARAGWNIRGEFVQNLADNKYRISVRGNILPMDIAHFMEKWWTRVMGSFNFEGADNFPYVDVRVESAWGNPERLWCFGGVNGKNAEYSGAHFDKFSLDIWINPKRISLYDISIISGERRAHSSVEWLYADGITSYDSQKIFLESTLDTRELVALGGSDAEEVLDVVRFSEAPHVTLNALLCNPHKQPNGENIFNLEAFSAGITRVEFASLENLRFRARSDKIHTQIEDASFGFCGGSAGGDISLRKLSGGGMEFDASLSSDKMNQAEFAKFLMSLDSPDWSVPEDADQNQFVKSGADGSVNMSLNLTGATNDFNKSVGYGYVSLENGNLMQLHLLGLLSRALSALKLPLGTFDLTYAASPFAIADAEIKFTRLELGGPVMRIKGAASYAWTKDSLNSILAVYPFGGVSTPVFSEVVSLVRPLISAVQVEIGGRISDPKISVGVNPSNILQSEKSILNEIRNEF